MQFSVRAQTVFLLLLATVVVWEDSAFGQSQKAESWQTPYSGDDSAGPTVIGHWQFDAGAITADSGPLQLNGRFAGAVPTEQGKFGGGMESFLGYPIEDKRHALTVTNHPALSPGDAFTVEMWLRPKPELAQARLAYLIDKKYASNNDYQWYLSSPDKIGQRRMTVVLGFGSDVESFTTEPLPFEPDQWQHVAFTYDGAGTVQFYRNGSTVAQVSRPGRYGIAAGKLSLSIGDRIGSNYGGFPGFIDEVRITTGVREYSPLSLTLTPQRTVWLRNERAAPIVVTVQNLLQEPVQNARLQLLGRGWIDETVDLPELAAGAVYETTVEFDTSLRPGEYELRAAVTTPGNVPIVRENRQSLKLMPRRVPHTMPVLMWGLASPAAIEQEIPRLKRLGFNHSLGFAPSPNAVWEAQQVVPADSPSRIKEVRTMLDQALANEVDIAASLYAGYFLKDKKELSRVDRAGNPYTRHDINASLPGLTEFSENFGRSVGQMYGDHPAFVAALINSEVRDSTHVSFSPFDRERYREFSGTEVPELVGDKIGPSWTKIPDFPQNRVLPHDDPLLTFYRWFWTVGDGWNPLHTALHRGLQADGRDRIWTFYDPAIRVPSIGGSGGQVDVLSQWTYTEPSPLRVGYYCDELFAMAQASPKPQDVMKMTQLFWYRSSSAPKKAGENFIASPFDDHDPDAAYISIAPMHLRGSFWTKIARPIKGLMYHGWASLVPTDGTSGYKYTQPDLQTEFQRLHRDILEPLGPTLLQLPDRPADVAYLESFTSQMLARRGSYGYYHDEAYLTLLHAQLQPEILYEQTLIEQGLDQYKLLVLADCDVLTQPVVTQILEFQKRGGIVIGDANLTPAITPEITIPKFVRTKRTAEDQATILRHAAKLRTDLTGRYQSHAACSTPEIVTRTRSTGAADYLFVVNDRREFGTYVGQHGLVMENGLPSEGTLTLQRNQGHVYDLLKRQKVQHVELDGELRWPVQLGPCDGSVFLVTAEPIADVTFAAPDQVSCGQSLELTAAVVDPDGEPIPTVIPLEVKITDPAGRPGEFSGHYGAAEGQLKLTLDLASNDRPGVWQIQVRELASGLIKSHYFRVERADE